MRTIRVTFTCSTCLAEKGATEEASAPENWLTIKPEGDRAEIHLCDHCKKVIEQAVKYNHPSITIDIPF